MMRRNPEHRWACYLRERLVHIAGCKECQAPNNELFFAAASVSPFRVRVPRSLRRAVKASCENADWVNS